MLPVRHSQINRTRQFEVFNSVATFVFTESGGTGYGAGAGQVSYERRYDAFLNPLPNYYYTGELFQYFGMPLSAQSARLIAVPVLFEADYLGNATVVAGVLGTGGVDNLAATFVLTLMSNDWNPDTLTWGTKPAIAGKQCSHSIALARTVNNPGGDTYGHTSTPNLHAFFELNEDIDGSTKFYGVHYQCTSLTSSLTSNKQSRALEYSAMLWLPSLKSIG